MKHLPNFLKSLYNSVALFSSTRFAAIVITYELGLLLITIASCIYCLCTMTIGTWPLAVLILISAYIALDFISPVLYYLAFGFYFTRTFGFIVYIVRFAQCYFKNKHLENTKESLDVAFDHFCVLSSQSFLYGYPQETNPIYYAYLLLLTTESGMYTYNGIPKVLESILSTSFLDNPMQVMLSKHGINTVFNWHNQFLHLDDFGEPDTFRYWLGIQDPHSFEMLETRLCVMKSKKFREDNNSSWRW